MNSMESRTFRRKLDMYYIMLLAYVVTGAVYIVISGSFIGDKFEFVVRDPVVYVFALFMLYATILLFVNVVQRRRLVVTDQYIMFESRFGQKRWYINHIERIVLKRERRRPSNVMFNIVKLRIANRRRWIRIRAAHYEREQELYEAFRELKQRLKK